MTDTLITFPTAKLAKEKGFDIPLYTSYINGVFHENEAEPNGYDGWDVPDKENWNKKNWVFTKEGNSCFGCKLDNIKYFEACSAPTQSLLQKWLREVHKIHIDISTNNVSYSSTYTIWSKRGFLDESGYTNLKQPNILETLSRNRTYEEALEEGLLNALKLIQWIQNK